MAITDWAVICSSIYLILRGYLRGFMNSLLGPFSVIIATIASYIYYQKTNDMVNSLIIGVIGPIVLLVILKIIFKSMSTNKSPSLASSLGGAALTLAWGWTFIVFALMLFAMLPPVTQSFIDVSQDVQRSISYSMIKPIENMCFGQTPKSLFTAQGAPQADVQAMSQDPRFQKIMQDPQIQEEINAHDYARLISNPKVMELTKEIMSDPAMLKKVMTLYRSQAQAQPQGNTPTSN